MITMGMRIGVLIAATLAIGVNGIIEGEGTWKIKGHAQAPDGSVWVIGGDWQKIANPEIGFSMEPGIEARRKIVPAADGSTPKWENEDVHGKLDGGARWYPTVVAIVAIFSGTTSNLDFSDLGKNKNPTYEYYPPKAKNNLRTLEILE
ncbi:hypothetical protein HDU96_008540 [Phlyctochytrium bullatum]|nr:hypothetical protein HDU96_008540 [Phlyctochytrium bullatum]